MIPNLEGKTENLVYVALRKEFRLLAPPPFCFAVLKDTLLLNKQRTSVFYLGRSKESWKTSQDCLASARVSPTVAAFQAS